MSKGARLTKSIYSLYGAVAVIILVACVTQVGAQPVLSSADLTAKWVSPDGGSITFAATHRFTATGLRIGKFWRGCARLGEISGSGNWQFLNSHGDSGVVGFTRGSLVSLTFEGRSSACIAGQLTLTSWNVGSKRGLCVQFDPDTPCDGYVFDKR